MLPLSQTLPLAPPEAVPIDACFSMVTRDGVTTYFSNLFPFDCHRADDVRAKHFRMARFHVVSAVRRLAAHREADREAVPGGMSGRAAAKQLGISPSTFSENRRAGVIAKPAAHDPSPPAVVDRNARERRDRQAPMGRAARDVEGRMLACAGLMKEVEPGFGEPAHAVVRGGVLAALPMLLDEGLVGAANRLLRLPNGYYGLTTILLFVALMTLARVRNPESVRYQAPGEWGCVLGLDRGPEVKTLRRKIKLIANARHTVRDWQAALAREWQDHNPELYATLAVDGHVKVYTGRKGKLPKHFVARQKLCLPASISYWLNALGASPLLCLHQPLDAKMVKALEHEVVPQLEALGVLTHDAPDLTGANPGAPAVTLVFDREGWSPALFRRLARRGVAVITWHKNFKGEDWPETDFRELEAPIAGPAHTGASKVALAEKRVVLASELKVRQIRRRLDNARQVPLITTHPTMATEQIAGAMFSRWSQENFFKYMREEFNLDALPAQGLEPLDPQAMIVNPTRRTLDKNIRKARARLASLYKRIAQATKNATNDAVQRHQREALDIDREIHALTEQRKGLPTHVRVADHPEHQRPETLPEAERAVPGHHPHDRLPRRNAHDAGPDRRAGQETQRAKTAPYPVHLRRGHHSTRRRRHSPRALSRARKPSLRTHARPSHQRTQPHTHRLPRNQAHVGL